MPRGMRFIQNYSDDALFSLIKEGEEDAFVELYNRYWEKMYQRAYLLLNSREDAEEQVHDVFVTFWQKKHTIEIRYSIHTYLSAMLRYGCFKVLAGRNKKIIIDEEIGDVELADCSTEHYLDFEELRETLEQAVCKLPEKCLLIFRMSREENLADKEIAERLGISVNTVRTQMHRALQKLKVSLRSMTCLLLFVF